MAWSIALINQSENVRLLDHDNSVQTKHDSNPSAVNIAEQIIDGDEFLYQGA